MGELDGKVAIVTGAGRLRGIGRCTAVDLAKLGADVVVTGTGRNPDTFPDDEKAIGWRDVESVADQIREQGSRALALTADVTREDHIKNMVERTLEEFGRVDILINNAAYPRGNDRVPVVDLPTEIFERVMDIKVLGTYLSTKYAVKHMIEQGDGGKIVNISSVLGKKGAPNTLAYNAANFAVIGMTQSMAKEFGPFGINVNAVCPGVVDTSRMDVIDKETAWQELAAETPIGRNGTDEEVGAFCVYLCTEAASWIHGQSINLCGGTTMEH